MSAILSTDDLNDFINPGVACIKPVETLPLQQPTETLNEYEVTTEDKIASTSKPPPAQISLTDCLACSGCVTSAEAVLVSLQSHGEVLDTLDKYHELRLPGAGSQFPALSDAQAKIFVASVSPQARASLAATYGVSERQAGNMIDQLLRGPQGVRSGGQHGSGFAWVIDTNAMREASLVAAADEVAQSTQDEAQKKPVITSACPGWICYAEKTHPHILPHLSKLKSPQALTGVLVKSVLSKKYGIPPQNIWHLAVMPCFDKKLEASRSELTSHSWHGQTEEDAVRDVDCVITARELLMLAESRNISFPRLPKRPVTGEFAPSFADPGVDSFLFAPGYGQKRKREDVESIGTSGGYLHHILKTRQVETPGSTISFQRGRNTDVAEYSVLDPSGQTVFKAARYYGFRNIQNLVRRLKPAKASRMPGAAARKVGTARRPGAAAGTSADGDYAYVEVMACPGGCTNGGGQIKVGDVATLRQVGGTGIVNGEGLEQEVLPAQREWLAKVDEAYWSADTHDEGDGDTEDGSNATRGENSANASHNTNSTTKDHDGDITMSNDPPPSSSSSPSSTSPARDSVLSTDTDNPSGSSSSSSSRGEDLVDGISRRRVRDFLAHWSDLTGIEPDVLLKTTYRVVESDVGKNKSGGSDVDRVNALAHAAGGGW